MENEKMTVLQISPNAYPKKIELSDTLEDLQQAVGGYIQALYPFKDKVALIVNDEGKLDGLPLNRALRDEQGKAYDMVAGPFLVVGLGEENFTSLTPELLEKYAKLFHRPEIFIQIGRQTMVLPIPYELVGKAFQPKAIVPVYLHSWKEAKKSNELDVYFASHRLNILCKEQIEEVIRTDFDGMHLEHDAAQKVIDEFGIDRVTYVLASTIQVKEWDGRFSRSNKEWSHTIVTTPDELAGIDHRSAYAVDSHSAVLNGFVDLTRKAIQEQEQQKALSLSDRLVEAKDAVQQQNAGRPPVSQSKKQENSL